MSDQVDRSVAANGYDAIREMLIKTFRIRGPTEHWTHDVTVKIDPSNPDLATGLVLGHAQTSPDGVVSNAAMRFKDQYRREGGVAGFLQKEQFTFCTRCLPANIRRI